MVAAIACAAASSMPSVIAVARASKRAAEDAGKASRTVDLVRVVVAAAPMHGDHVLDRLGWYLRVGFAMAKMIGAVGHRGDALVAVTALVLM